MLPHERFGVPVFQQKHMFFFTFSWVSVLRRVWPESELTGVAGANGFDHDDDDDDDCDDDDDDDDDVSRQKPNFIQFILGIILPSYIGFIRSH